MRTERFSLYPPFEKHVLHRVDSEKAHDVAIRLLHLAESNPFTLGVLERVVAYKGKRFTDEKLRVVIGGREYENPLGVGAGWDKDGRAVRGLWKLGFGHVEAGTVLVDSQDGNSGLRLEQVGPGVACNCFGFPSAGMKSVRRNLEMYDNGRGETGIPIGINVGKNRMKSDSSEEVARLKREAPLEYASVVRELYGKAAYFAINLSSPNTAGLRRLQEKEPLLDIVNAVHETMDELGGRKPVFIKISPDLTPTAVDDVVQVVVDNGVTGIIAANTTTNPDIKKKYCDGKWAGRGGLSGADPKFREITTRMIAHIFREAGDQVEIIGVGGINSAETALEKIKAGAKVIQVVTAMRQVGPSLPGRINRGLADYMEKEGVKNIGELVGVDADKHGSLL